MIRFLHRINDRIQYLKEKEDVDMDFKKSKRSDTFRVC